MLTTLHFLGCETQSLRRMKEDGMSDHTQEFPQGGATGCAGHAGVSGAFLRLPLPIPSVQAAIRSATPRGARPHTAIRSWRERLIQTLGLELSAMIFVAPLLAYFADVSVGKSMITLIAVSIAMMCWSVPFNTVFDLIEYHCAGRVASDRPHGWRVLHTIAHEASAILVTCPVIVALTSLGWRVRCWQRSVSR